MTLTPKHLRLSQLRPLAPASEQSLAAAWELGMDENPDQFPDLRKLIPDSLP